MNDKKSASDRDWGMIFLGIILAVLGICISIGIISTTAWIIKHQWF